MDAWRFSFPGLRVNACDVSACVRLGIVAAQFAFRFQSFKQGVRFIREGHGDLHCGNVVRWQGSLVAFDGLEFDPALRFIDVANDIAFLTVGLCWLGAAIGRVISIFLDHGNQAKNWIAVGFECAIAALLLVGLSVSV